MIQSSAIFMVVAVSAERYRAVCHPMSKRQAQCPIWRIFHHYFLDIVNKYQQVKLSKFISQHFLKMQFGISANLAFDTLKLMQFELFYLIIHSPLVSNENSARKSNGLGFSVNIPFLIFDLYIYFLLNATYFSCWSWMMNLPSALEGKAWG